MSYLNQAMLAHAAPIFIIREPLIDKTEVLIVEVSGVIFKTGASNNPTALVYSENYIN